MAFDSTIIVLGKRYDPDITKTVLEYTDSILYQFGIKIERLVDSKEYENMTSSKEINRYVRVKSTDLKEQKKEATKLIKIGTSRIQAFERFASAKYAFFSISDLEDGEHTVIWFSFHSRLIMAFSEFRDFSYTLARQLSRAYRGECYSLEASSFSRNSDRFVLYVNGRERNKLSTKGALTEARKLYGLDINALMTNVDKNMAIYYAPRDHRETLTELRAHEKRYEEWQKTKDTIKIENKEDGSNMMDVFEKENNIIVSTLKQKLSAVEIALKKDPIGSVVYFKMNDLGNTAKRVSENERLFGREVNNHGA